MSYFPSGRNAGFALTATDAGLVNSRVLAQGAGIQLIDNGTNLSIASYASAAGAAAPVGASYVTISSDSTLTAERTLAVSSDLSLTDNGANSSVQIGLQTVAINKGGTGQTTATLGFNALSPLTTKGDIIVRDGTNNVRSAAGSDNTFVVYDASQSTGIKTSWGAFTGASSITANTTLIAGSNAVFLVDASGAARTVALPTASTATSKVFCIKKTDSSTNTVTVQRGASADTIDGATTFVMQKQYDAVTLFCDGSAWYVI